jgi:hypothetical protein
MDLVSKQEMKHFLIIEKQMSNLTDADCENPTPKNEKIMNEYLALIERYDHMGISTEGYARYYNLID